MDSCGNQLMQADLAQSLEIFRQVDVPQRDRLVPGEAERPSRRRVSSITPDVLHGMSANSAAPALAGRSGRSRRPRPERRRRRCRPRSTSAARAQVIGREGRAIGADDQRRAVRRRDRRQHARAEIAVGLARERDAERARQSTERPDGSRPASPTA